MIKSKRNYVLLCVLFSVSFFSWSQSEDITESLYQTYEKYREPALDKRRIKHHELQPLLTKYRIDPKFTVKVVGKSIEGRDLSLVSIGKGEIDVFLFREQSERKFGRGRGVRQVCAVTASLRWKVTGTYL